MIANIRQLRSSTKEILNAVSRGDTVFIFKRGKACAQITPLPKEKIPVKTSPLFGIWANNPKISSPAEYVRTLRKGRYAR